MTVQYSFSQNTLQELDQAGKEEFLSIVPPCRCRLDKLYNSCHSKGTTLQKLWLFTEQESRSPAPPFRCLWQQCPCLGKASKWNHATFGWTYQLQGSKSNKNTFITALALVPHKYTSFGSCSTQYGTVTMYYIVKLIVYKTSIASLQLECTKTE